MRLERLELSGFKSFSDRSELAFDSGVTAIVGPNGCGKSNVADALTWVLGEQSAKSLRGDKMEDVIFNGSDARKPTGAAEVRLRLSGVPVPPSLLPSAEGDGVRVRPATAEGAADPQPTLDVDVLQSVRDVEVTRRLFRSGESEYLIDGQHCRLKDIHELLMDTGLGAKAYSIIEQGKIGMILSSRPTDRRQLIEEAAGITKYKARRRSAELKLEAAQQNLTRIDDIVFEVEKQRGSLKRQAARTRRFIALRDEMRRWEKVLFARRYRQLAEAIESARTRLAGAREQEGAAGARLAEVENTLARVRIELAQAEQAASAVREKTHAHELEINRRQQQVALETQQAGMLRTRSGELQAEVQGLEARREPERVRLEERRDAVREAERARDAARGVAEVAAEAYASAQRAIEGVEHDVEQARTAVYAVLQTVTTLTAAAENAGAQRDRAAEALARLEAEAADLRTEQARAREAQAAAAAELARVKTALEDARLGRVARESELAAARTEHDWRARDVRQREQQLAGLEARLRSLEELDAHRAGFGDAARLVLARANGQVQPLGAVADYLEVDSRFERAVEACLGDLLQHVVVARHEHAQAGFRLVREEAAGRCGFLVLEGLEGLQTPTASAVEALAPGVTRLGAVARVSGPHAAAIAAAMGDALIADDYTTAAALARTARVPVVTTDGDVFRGAHVVAGGSKAESRGILATKREIKDLREQLTAEREALARLAEEAAGYERAMAHATAAIAGLTDELHRQEKLIVGVEAQAQRAGADEARVGQRALLVAGETDRVRGEIAALEARQAEARESLRALENDRAAADAALGEAQRRLADARERAEDESRRAAEARAAHAGLIERCAGTVAEVQRLEEAQRDLEQRLETCRTDLALMADQAERLLASAAEAQRQVDADVLLLDQYRDEMHRADDAAGTLKADTERQEDIIRDARRALDAVRALASELEISRATAESDLAHLAQQCIDSVQVSLDDVAAEVEQMERDGVVEPDARVIRAVEAEEPDEESAAGGAAVAAEVEGAGAEGLADGESAVSAAPVEPPAPVRMTAEEAIAALRARIDRLGPVNMMAVQQHEELEQRHVFLTTQRADLIDSIAQTNEAIKRIDETTHARFREAFAVINGNFQQTFTTLFGGGRAGLTLLDDQDPLESGIDIVASPPGKRLQNVMLLSGGEKALTAIALMFAIFRYKPSPFCLLDEIDAPLDDANIGRFVEMLRGMLDQTQFIIITHSRKTMEIADRLYGVTMEEPGVSKLISMQMH